ncbi:MAG: DUF456 domain-containing protein, partial [Planctomycetota bacterium]
MTFSAIMPMANLLCIITLSWTSMLSWIGLASFWQSMWQPVSGAATTGGLWLLAILLVVGCVAAWLSNLIALPGNWLAIAFMALYVWMGPEQDSGRTAISINAVVAAFGLGLLGEILEFAASAVGARRAGGSRRATVYAILGSVLGAIAGGIIGIPIPVLGSVLAAILFGGLGATCGAVWAEWSDGRPWQESWRVGQAAFWGRT